jgi:hypothetical protein
MTSRKVKERTKEIKYMPQFPYVIYITYTNDIKASYEKRRESAIDPRAGGVTLGGDGISRIILENNAPLDYTVHECSHAIFNLLNDLGVEETERSGHELFCYLVGHLAKEAIMFQKRK